MLSLSGVQDTVTCANFPAIDEVRGLLYVWWCECCFKHVCGSRCGCDAI